MKLKYLFLAMLATAGFVSCSSEDDKVDPNATYDAEINVAVSPSTEVSTKASVADASTNGTTGEQLVSRLTAFVFDASDKVVGVSDTTNTLNPTVNIDRIKRIVVKATESGTDYKLFVIANLKGSEATAVTSLLELNSKITNLSQESKDTHLTMTTTSVIPIKVKGMKDVRVYENYVVSSSGAMEYGIPITYTTLDSNSKIQLTRLVARIDLNSIKIDFVGGNFENASFTVDSVYMVNVNSQSHFTEPLVVDGSYWNARELPSFTVYNSLISPNGVNPTAHADTYGKKINQTIDNGKSISTNQLTCYTFVNPSVESTPNTYNTRLIINGTINYATGQKKEAYYHITIKDVATADYVLRNTIYKIDVTITGEGSPNEDQKSGLNAGINAKVTVSPWKVVNQTEDDAN